MQPSADTRFVLQFGPDGLSFLVVSGQRREALPVRQGVRRRRRRAWPIGIVDERDEGTGGVFYIIADGGLAGASLGGFRHA